MGFASDYNKLREKRQGATFSDRYNALRSKRQATVDNSISSNEDLANYLSSAYDAINNASNYYNSATAGRRNAASLQKIKDEANKITGVSSTLGEYVKNATTLASSPIAAVESTAGYLFAKNKQKEYLKSQGYSSMEELDEAIKRAESADKYEANFGSDYVKSLSDAYEQSKNALDYLTANQSNIDSSSNISKNISEYMKYIEELQDAYAEQSDYYGQWKNAEEYSNGLNFADTAKKTLQSAINSMKGGYVGAEAMASSKKQTELTAGQSAQAALNAKDYETVLDEVNAQRQERAAKKEAQALKFFEAAQEQKNIAQWKKGLVGSTLVDLGTQLPAYASDAALSVAGSTVGMPELGLVTMAVRAYGQSAIEARQEGLSWDKAELAGIKSAAIEVITEKALGGATRWAYGKGFMDSTVEAAVESAINRVSTNKYVSAGLKYLADAGEEGIEEMASDVLNPIADRILNLKNEEGEYLDSASIEDVVYDGIVGFLMGVVGGTGNVVTSAVGNVQQGRVQTEIGKAINANDYAEALRALVADSSNEQVQKTLSEKQTDRNLGKLYQQYQASTLQDAIEQRLSGKENAKEIANAVAKYVRGESLTALEEKYFNTPEAADAVLELQDSNRVKQINDTLTNEWAVNVNKKLSEVNNKAFNNAKTAVLDGKAIKIKSVKVEGNKVMAVTEDGAVDAPKLSMTGNAARLASAAASYGESAPVFFSAYTNGQNITSYANAFDIVYTYGQEGIAKDKLANSEATKILSPEQIDVIYEEGASKRVEIKATKKHKAKGGKLSYDGGVVGGTKYEAVSKERRQDDDVKTAAQVLKKLGETLGVNFVLYESKAKNGKYQGAQGVYSSNTVYIDVNAGRNITEDIQTAILRTASHELTHFIQDYSPAKYAELRKFVITHLVGKNLSLDELIANKQARSKGKLTRSEAIDEIVADGCEMMLKDTKAIETLARENKNLAKIIQQWIKDFIRNVKKAFTGVEAVYDESKAMMDALDELQALWDSALVSAAKGEEYTVLTSEGEARRGEIESFNAEARRRMSDADRVANSPIKFSERDVKTDRQILAESLETAAKTSNEKGMLKDYKAKVDKLNSLQDRLSEKRKAIVGTKGSERIAIQNSIDTLKSMIKTEDEKLLKMQATAPLKNVVTVAREEERVAAKARQAEAVTRIREQKNERIAEVKAKARQHEKEAVAKVREQRDEKLQAIKDHNKEVKQNAKERADKATMKKKIVKKIKDINSIFTNGSKERNVKEGMRSFIASALATGELLFSEMTEEDIVRAGVPSTTTDETEMLNTYNDLLETKSKLSGELEALYKSGRNFNEIDDVEGKIKTLNGRISSLKSKLADVFTRERNRLNRVVVSGAINELATGYRQLLDSGDDYIKAAYSEGVYTRLLSLATELGGATIKDMSIPQLQAVYDAYHMIDHTIRVANTLFVDGKREDVIERGKRIMGEIKTNASEHVIKAFDGIKAFSWNNLKPVYAFRRIGSDGLTELYKQLLKGQNTFARDSQHAEKFINDLRRECHYTAWDFDKVFSIKLESGRVFKLNLEQIMSIYAYSNREQAAEHMAVGGFMYDVTQSFKEGKELFKRRVNSATAFRISSEDMDNILSKLTVEQRRYVVKAQDYLTRVCAANGNEVSREVYGIDIFKERVYFPLVSARQFIASEEKAVSDGLSSLKNAGMTKEITPKAKNPIILKGFDEVWDAHVNKMATYHGFVLPIENIVKVMNYAEYLDEETDSKSIKSAIEAAFGSNEPVKYIEGFLRDLNGGTRSGTVSNPFVSLVGKFKKTAVAASMSVVVQQPSAILRAMQMIKPKYFVGKLSTKQTWSQLKKYAPIAYVKEMGGFDAGMGKRGYYLKKEYDSGKLKALLKDENYRDDALMYLAGKADEIAWCYMWEAVKREMKATSKLSYGSEEFLKACGERFTEVVDMTQVYDSTLSRSAYMRDKGDIMKMATAFMGEPTTTVNMLYDALLQFRMGKASIKDVAGTIGACVASTIVADIAKTFIYALRDDDDDNYWDKYFEKLADNIVSDTFVPNMLPFVKDIVSVFDGWDVERADLAIANDIYDAYNALDSDSKSMYRKIEDFAGAVAALGGIPIKNVMRDARSIFNIYRNAMSDTESNGIGAAFTEGLINGIPFKGEQSRTEQLKKAILRGKPEKAARIMAEYANEKTAATQYKKACVELYNEGRLTYIECLVKLADVMTYSEAEKYLASKLN